MTQVNLASRLVLFVLLAASAAAQSLVGQLLGPNGVGVAGATFIFSNGGPTVTTGLNGMFNFIGLRDRIYDTIQIDPRLPDAAPKVLTSVSVQGVTNIGIINLDPGATVTGTFLSPTGAGLLGGNISAFEPATGVKLYTPHNGMDLAGNVSIVVPLGTFDFRAVPPVGAQYIPYFRRHTVTGPLSLGTNTLQQGYVVSGSVVDSVSLLPVGNAQLEPYNALTGQFETLQSTSTNAFGAFSMLLPFGLHRIEVLPPVGNAHLARELFNVTVLRPMSIGQIALRPTVTLTGTVMGPAGPVANADIDVITADGYKLFTIRDNTLPTGQFAVQVPPGTYTVRVDPEPASGLVGTRTAQVAVAGPTNIGVVNLQAGIPVQIHVVDGLGADIAGADLNVFNSVTGQEVIVVGDTSNAVGQMTVGIPAGTYDLVLSGRQGSPYGPLVTSGVSVTAPMSRTLTMPNKLLVTNLTTFGTPGVSLGAIPVNLSFHVKQATALPTNFELFVELPNGTEIPLLPPIGLDLFPNFPFTLAGVWIPSPPLPPGQELRVLRLVTRYTNPANGALYDRSHVDFVVE